MMRRDVSTIEREVMKARYSIDEMYTAWVLHKRNAAEAAKALGMQGQALRYHVREHRFEDRYLAESSGVAEAQRRLAYIQMASGLGELTDHLHNIALGKACLVDDEGRRKFPSFKEQVMAAQTILRAFPPIMSEVESKPTSLTLVDARSIAIGRGDGVTLSVTPEPDDREGVMVAADHNDIVDYSQFSYADNDDDASSALAKIITDRIAGDA